jgi:D-aspartate ligase
VGLKTENETDPKMNLTIASNEPDAPGSGVLLKEHVASTSFLRQNPVFLANADFYGTLAATRALGALGVPVYVGSDRRLAPSSWSRHAKKVFRCPPFAESERFVDWLADLGAREPGIVLVPTSDEAAFLYALHRERLQEHFRMFGPSLEAIIEVLDKKRLYENAARAGLEVPPTWFPETDADVERIAREAPFPLLIKPRTQVLSWTHSKGVRVTNRADLLPLYRKFAAQSRYGEALVAHVPDASRPMVQTYVPDAATQIYVLAAFLDRSGELFAARSGMKIFQRPRTLGIGLCFEESPLDPEVAEGARRLARRAGYYGLFQLEFIRIGDRSLLIDYNPRFYNQLSFDMARGLPLSELAYQSARGHDAEVVRLLSRVPADRRDEGFVFCNEFGLELLLATQRLAGRLSRADVRRWRQWRADHRGRLINPVATMDDALPMAADVASQLLECVRHPRAFLRNVVLDRAAG